MKAPDTLQSTIRAYTSRLYQDPEVKNEVLDLDGLSGLIPRRQLSSSFRNLMRGRKTIFESFSLAKHALEMFIRSDSLSVVNDLIPSWLLSCVEAGAYEDCIRFADSCVNSDAWTNPKTPVNKFSVLRSRAKSLRNIGRLEEAQTCYRQIISMASELNERAEICLGLIFIGKLYGNYWGQLSLFTSFVEEAQSRLNSELRSRQNGAGPARERLNRCLAICHDALGQAYRDSELGQVADHFQKAIKLNERLNRRGGISRAKCHLSQFRFRHSTAAEKPLHFEQFRLAVKLLLDEVPDERGLGIRYIQMADMQLEMHNTLEAEQHLEVGKFFAARYSEYKTLTRAALVEASLYKLHYPERAYQALTDALAIARAHKLQIQESDINLRLTELSGHASLRGSNESQGQITQLYERNREIYLGLIREVKDSLSKLDAASSLPPEFELLSTQSRRAFREKLLLDFDHTVNQLNLNIDSLVSALISSERKRQKLVVIEVLNSVARLLLHEYKNTILSPTTLTPLQDIAFDLEKMERRLCELRDCIGADRANAENVDLVTEALRKSVIEIRSLGEELGNLKVLLTERLKRPDKLRDRTSLLSVVEQSIRELKQQYPETRSLIDLDPSCDVTLMFNRDMILTGVHNLIRNAIEELSESAGAERKILVSLAFEPVGSHRLNPSVTGTLSIITVVESTQRAAKIAAAIRLGLEEHTSTKGSGWGVGMEMANLFFQELMGARLQAVENGKSAGIKILFHIDSLDSRIERK